MSDSYTVGILRVTWPRVLNTDRSSWIEVRTFGTHLFSIGCPCHLQDDSLLGISSNSAAPCTAEEEYRSNKSNPESLISPGFSRILCSGKEKRESVLTVLPRNWSSQALPRQVKDEWVYCLRSAEKEKTKGAFLYRRFIIILCICLFFKISTHDDLNTGTDFHMV